MTYDHETQLRVDCLSDAIRAMSVTPCTADEIVKTAEAFLSFVIARKTGTVSELQAAQGNLTTAGLAERGSMS